MRLLLLISLLLAAASCQPEADPAAPVRVRDGLGRALILPAHPRRVLALAPDMTEMLYVVADTATIVGRGPQANFPAAARRKPVVNNHPLDLEKLVLLRPDVVFTVEGMTTPDDARRLQKRGIPVFYQRYQRVEDVFAGLEELGRLLGRPAPAHHAADSLRRALRTLIPSSAYPLGEAPTVLAITGQDPIHYYGQNTLFTDAIRLAGGQNAVAETFPQPFPTLTQAYILQLNPDVLLGGSFEKLDSTFFKKYPELRRIKAYQTRRVFPITGHLLERPGPRVVELVRELQGLIRK